MTPQSSLGMGNADTGFGASGSNLYNNISSAGVPEEVPQQAQTPKEPNPSEQFIIQFGSTFTPFLKFMESYPQSSPKADAVKKAVENWMSDVAAQLPQNQGGESSSL